MLTRILKALARKESVSMTQLAHELNSSPKELESALKQMEHMGYVRREMYGQTCSGSCESDKSGRSCEGCGFASSEVYSFWALTERGAALADTSQK